MPAGATLTPPFANTIVGSGSSTTFFMMQDLDELFNRSPGCDEFVPFPSASNPQPLDDSCTPNVFAETLQPFESGVPNAFPENLWNDISVQEQPLGSSNGIAALEDQGAHGATANSFGTPINVANNVSYARSSRALKSSDLKGLNFIAYAQDGVSWFHYTSVGGTSTPSNAVTNLTQAQLQAIYNGTDTNWNQVGGANAPIVVFSAQEGSGTQSTWSTFMGFDPSAATNKVNCYTPSGGSNTCVGPGVIFENEDAQIEPSSFTTSQAGFVNNNPGWGASGVATAAQIKSDAIFFFSSGKFDEQCAAGDCGGSPLASGDVNSPLGQVNGIAPSETTILEGTFPVDRFLYNVYSNGSNTNIPQAGNSIINYVGEDGFICNPNKTQSFQVVDMNTGKTYLSEIQAAIENNGFYPLSAGAASGTVNTTPIDEGTLPHPQKPTGFFAFLDVANKASNGDPMGYCLTTNTDGNANS